MTSDQQTEFDRIRGYLNSQGERSSHSEIWPRAIKARMQLLDSLEKVNDEQASWAPSDENWSIKEVALHILNSSRSVRQIVHSLSEGKDADSSGIEPPRKTTDAPVAELYDELRDDGIEWTVAITALPQMPPLEPTANHSMFGDLHARAWHLFQRVHDLDHMNQIEAVKQAEGYPAA
jgi:uncharacterized damage-inducible protein DinB